MPIELWNLLLVEGFCRAQTCGPLVLLEAKS